MNERRITMTIEIELTKPIEFLNETHRVLKLREPDFGDFRKATEATSDSFGQFLKVLELTNEQGFNHHQIDSISGKDFNNIFQKLSPFLAPFITTGMFSSIASQFSLPGFTGSQAK